jgi:hypothetical protein
MTNLTIVVAWVLTTMVVAFGLWLTTNPVCLLGLIVPVCLLVTPRG